MNISAEIGFHSRFIARSSTWLAARLELSRGCARLSINQAAGGSSVFNNYHRAFRHYCRRQETVVDPRRLLSKSYFSPAHSMDKTTESKTQGEELMGELKDYVFPDSKVKRTAETGKQPIVLVALWSTIDLDRILSRGVFVIERPGTDESDALAALSQWKENINLVPQLIPNEISSTRVR
ncbi:MAG: hypothetical protein Q9195_000138 [Heterodermia aff. obscurata]